MSEHSIESKEWEILYNAVQNICRKHGKEDPYGKGDYWLVDDNWGGVSQKLVVSSPSFLTPSLVRELAGCISQTELFGAQIVVVLDLSAHAIKLPPMMGLLIDSEGAIEEWDIKQLRSQIGEEFFVDQ